MRILFAQDLHYSASNIPTRRDNFPDTMLDKTEQMLEIGVQKQIDILLLGGDITHGPRLSTTYFNKLVALFRKYPFPKGTTIGNHDIFNGDPSTIDRTPLGTFLTDQTFIPTPGTWTYETEDTIIVFMPYMVNPVPFPLDNPKGKTTILVGHAYLPGKFSSDNLPVEMTTLFDYIFLGHDHDFYMHELVNRSVVIRPGALSRGTRHQSNWDRTVQVAFLDTKERTIEYIPLKFKPAIEIFSQERLALEKKLRDTRAIDDFTKSVILEGSSDIPKIIESLKFAPEVKERIEVWLRSVGLL